MQRAAFIALVVIAALPAAAKETRCGWLANPTPGNFWLNDKDGEWILALQGGYQADGMDDMPDVSAKGWVKTNGYYGYGCACMDVDVDRADKKVVKLHATRPQPLKACRGDKALNAKKPG